MTNWTADKDDDGVPDAVEDAVEEAVEEVKESFASRTFTKRNMYLSIVIGLIIAGYGLFAYMYLSLRDEKIAIQNQFDWFKSEQEIEINKAVMQERARAAAELAKKFPSLNDAYDKRKDDVNHLTDSIKNKPYKGSNEDEINKLDANELNSVFDDLGFPTVK